MNYNVSYYYYFKICIGHYIVVIQCINSVRCYSDMFSALRIGIFFNNRDHTYRIGRNRARCNSGTTRIFHVHYIIDVDNVSLGFCFISQNEFI